MTDPGTPTAVAPAAGRAPGLFTDLYELTMGEAYLREGMTDEAVFSLFVRRLPARRNFLLACGLDTVLGQLETFRFDDGDIAWLRGLGRFSEPFLAWLGRFRFSGEVRAVAEGTPVFADEPILEVRAPIAEAQLVETLVMSQIALQTVLASKAARVVAAAAGRSVVDFGARRMHGIDAAVQAARAFHIAGVDATSNMLAGRVHGVPVAGTMAHSYVQAHDDESAALRRFAEIHPGTILLVDTYDTLAGVRRVIDLARDGHPVSGVRLDSGDLGALARDARRMLDDAGLGGIEIFASGGLDEDEIARLVADGAPIDGFGIGTAMGVSADAPSLDIAYKLCAYAGRGRLKLSTGKPVLPGAKQVFRRRRDDTLVGDVIGRRDETLEGEPLLQTVMADGRRTVPPAELPTLREATRRLLAELPPALRALEPASPGHPVAVSAALRAERDAVVRRLRRGAPGPDDPGGQPGGAEDRRRAAAGEGDADGRRDPAAAGRARAARAGRAGHLR